MVSVLETHTGTFCKAVLPIISARHPVPARMLGATNVLGTGPQRPGSWDEEHITVIRFALRLATLPSRMMSRYRR
jgi:hypothetical protein